MNPHTMNRVPGVFLLLFGLLLVPLSVQSQLFRNEHHHFDLAAGQPLEFTFISQDNGFSITADLEGRKELLRLNDTTYQLRFQPNANWRGQSAIRIQGTSIQEGTDEGTGNYYLSLNQSDGSVTSYPDVATTYIGESIPIQVLDNDESHLRSIFLKAIPSISGGTVAFQEGGTELTFEPSPGFSGLASFTYLACDASDNCSLGEVSVWVFDPSSAQESIRLFTEAGKVLPLPVSADGFVLDEPEHGALVVDRQLMQYRTDANFSGKESMVIQMPSSPELQIELVVLPKKVEGFARKDQFYSSPGNVILIDLLKNDLFNGNEIGCVEVDEPSRGVLRPLNDLGKYAYEAPDHFVGVQTFSYRVLGPGCTGEADVAEALVYVGHFEPMYDRYELVAAAGMPLYIENEVPVSNFTWRMHEAPRFGTVKFLKGDTLTTSHLSAPQNGIMYTPDPSVSSGKDRMVLEYCMGEAFNCTFSKYVEVEIDIRSRSEEEMNYCFLDCVWPGDANNDGEVSMGDLLSIGRNMGETLPARSSSTSRLDWIGQDGPINLAKPALKHMDTDGNGIITSADTNALVSFWGRRNAIVPYVPVLPEATIELRYEGGPVAAGESIEIDIYLGSEQNPVYNLTGFSFPLFFNPELIQASSIELDLDNKGWFGLFSPILSLNRRGEGIFETGITRTSQGPISGYGFMGRFRVIVTEDINGIRPGTIAFGGGIASIQDQQGNQIPVRVSQVEIPFEPGSSTVTSLNNAPESVSQLTVFPNPARSTFSWEWTGEASLDVIEVFGMTGKQILQVVKPTSGVHSIDVSDWPNGVYLLRAHTNDRVLNQKVQVTH